MRLSLCKIVLNFISTGGAAMKTIINTEVGVQKVMLSIPERICFERKMTKERESRVFFRK